MLGGLLRDIHLSYPDTFDVALDAHYSTLWKFNPRVADFPLDSPNVRLAEVSWKDGILQHARARVGGEVALRHIFAWYHHDFEAKTSMHVPVSAPKGEIFMDPAADKPVLDQRYWVVMAGCKDDMTNKLWPRAYYQQVVDALQVRGIFCVQAGATGAGHIHAPLEHCLNLVGKTNGIHEFFNLIRRADGVVTPVSAAMHIAAVYDKPCVVIAGGREEPWFEWYGDAFQGFGPGCPPVNVPHKFLHTLNQLPCCSNDNGCWRRKTQPKHHTDTHRGRAQDLCLDPLQVGTDVVAHCMEMIKPSHVVEAVMKYFDEKLLPPVGATAEPMPPLPVSAPPPTIVPVAGRKMATAAVAADPGVAKAALPPQLGQPVAWPGAPAAAAPAAAPAPPDATGLDHPILGGKLTVCVLCYGDYLELHQRCLQSILASLPRSRMDLRIATNAVSQESTDFLRKLNPDVFYPHAENKFKYPVMRQMFYDTAHPLKTNYLAWFDDDTRVVAPDWAQQLATAVIAGDPQGFKLYGDRRFHDISTFSTNGHRPDRWFRQATWWRGVDLRVRGSNNCGPNGSCIDFPVGWFWVANVASIHQADAPDVRLAHNGGDIVIGAQFHQIGAKIRQFNANKSLVFTPPREHGGRRGCEQNFLWSGQDTSIRSVPPNR
jgi:hypothetical protein